MIFRWLMDLIYLLVGSAVLGASITLCVLGFGVIGGRLSDQRQRMPGRGGYSPGPDGWLIAGGVIGFFVAAPLALYLAFSFLRDIGL